MDNSTCDYPTRAPEFILALKIVVGTVCILSALGAGLIILTYALFKDLRTTTRLLLVNLSVADIIVALSHFVGLFGNYERFLELCPTYSNTTGVITDTFCSIQAALTVFGSIASFWWTVAIAVYLFTIIVLKYPEKARRLHIALYPFCWGIPAVIPIVFGAVRYLGWQETGDIGMYID